MFFEIFNIPAEIPLRINFNDSFAKSSRDSIRNTKQDSYRNNLWNSSRKFGTTLGNLSQISSEIAASKVEKLLGIPSRKHISNFLKIIPRDSWRKSCMYCLWNSCLNFFRNHLECFLKNSCRYSFRSSSEFFSKSSVETISNLFMHSFRKSSIDLLKSFSKDSFINSSRDSFSNSYKDCFRNSSRKFIENFIRAPS